MSRGRRSSLKIRSGCSLREVPCRRERFSGSPIVSNVGLEIRENGLGAVGGEEHNSSYLIHCQIEVAVYRSHGLIVVPSVMNTPPGSSPIVQAEVSGPNSPEVSEMW